ncbi:MAG: hypothetical protein ACREVJ_12880 [Gammaproteobacteria bacterium]
MVRRDYIRTGHGRFSRAEGQENDIRAVEGTVTPKGSAGGLALRPFLGDLPPATHRFHVHMNRSCGPGEKDGACEPILGRTP